MSGEKFVIFYDRFKFKMKHHSAYFEFAIPWLEEANE